MTDTPNEADFIKDERADEYDVTFSVRGTIRTTIKASSEEEARAKAYAMAEDEDFGTEIDEVDDVSVDWVGKKRPMYLVTRDGRSLKVSHLKPGDRPREPDQYGF